METKDDLEPPDDVGLARSLNESSEPEPPARFRRKSGGSHSQAGGAETTQNSGQLPPASASKQEDSEANTNLTPSPDGTAERTPIGKDANMPQPLVVDLGSLSSKEVRRLKRGKGRKMEEALHAGVEAKGSVGPDTPIVVLYRKKARRRRSLFPFPFPPFCG